MLLNDYDVEDIRDALADRDDLPNLRALATTLDNLRRWTNSNSDGWAYWNKPSNASRRAQECLYLMECHGFRLADIEASVLRRNLSPIKAFLTRQGVDNSTIIVNPEA